MTLAQLPDLDPKLDLVLERVIDVPIDLVWRAWTEPEHLKQWFTPVPWVVDECDIDLRPGGIFRVVQHGPGEGPMTNVCTYLEVVPGERLVWTDALGPGYRPAKAPFLGPVGHYTAVLTLEALGEKTRYTARVMHSNPEGRDKHQEFGFSEGWGTSLDQMVQYVKAHLR
jgi:uncharacterized protein YndB with AHSA1/START domain